MSSIKDFEVLSTLGSGSFSSVYKVRRISDGQQYALKKVKFPALKLKERENALNEVRILASINDKNIIAYKEAFYDDASQSLCIIMEHATGGDLMKKIETHKKQGKLIPEEMIWSYLKQMVQGIRTLHKMKILHRDIKCANIFLGDEGKTIKLGDLNVSKIAEAGLVYTQAGTPYYASPEIWQDKPYGNKSDIWSIGCVAYELCALQPPFRATTMSGLCQKIQAGRFDKIPKIYSSDLGKIIAMCLNVNPQMRPDCDKLLSHPALIARMSDDDLDQMSKNPDYHELLDTIKMPRNLKNLDQILPKPKYKKESISLIDLDDNQRHQTEDDYTKRILEQRRPLSRMNRANSKPNVLAGIEERLRRKNSAQEDSLERAIRGREVRNVVIKASANPEPLRRGISVQNEAQKNQQPIVQPKPTPTPVQRAGKAAYIMDIFRTKKKAPTEKLEKVERTNKVPSLNNIDIHVEDISRPIVGSKPSSRAGVRNVVDPASGRNVVLPRVNSNVQYRAVTPNPPHRKISDDYVRKDYGYYHDVRNNRGVRPIY